MSNGIQATQLSLTVPTVVTPSPTTQTGIVTGFLVTMTYSGSAVVSYRWVLAPPAGSRSHLDFDSSSSSSFTPDRPGSWTVELQATDSMAVTTVYTLPLTIALLSATEQASALLTPFVAPSQVIAPSQGATIFCDSTNGGTISAKDSSGTTTALGVAVTAVASVTAVKALTAGQYVDKQTRSLDDLGQMVRFDSSAGAGLAGDDQTYIKPSDVLTGSAGRWVVMGLPSLTTVTALRSADSGLHARVNVQGYASTGDGGGGTFVYKTGSAPTDDGGTVLRVSSSKWWQREFDGKEFVAEWFGTVGDGTTDDTTAIQKGIDASSAAGGHLILSKSHVCQNLTVTSATVLKGTQGAMLKQKATATHPILTATATLKASGIIFDGTKSTQTATAIITTLEFDGTSGGDLLLDSCTVQNVNFVGLYVDTVKSSLTVTNCLFKDAVERDPTNADATISLPAMHIKINAGTATGSISISRCVFSQTTVVQQTWGVPGIFMQSTLGTGTSFTDCLTASITDNYFYQIGAASQLSAGVYNHELGSIDVYNWVGRCVITGNRIYKPYFRCISIANACSVLIANNVISDATWQFNAQAILWTGSVPHPGTDGQPFDNCVIANNIIRNFPATGTDSASISPAAIYVAGTSGSSLEAHGVIVTGNVIDTCKSGIYAYAIGDIIISNNVVRNCWGIYSNGDSSVNLDHCVGDSAIIGNLFDNNNGHDCRLLSMSSARAHISSNTFKQSNTSLYNVRADAIGTIQITDNFASGTTHPIAVVSGVNIYIRGNLSDNDTLSLDAGATVLQETDNSWQKQADTTAHRPGNNGGLAKGTMYFDTDLGYAIWWDGAAWVDATGAGV